MTLWYKRGKNSRSVAFTPIPLFWYLVSLGMSLMSISSFASPNISCDPHENIRCENILRMLQYIDGLVFLCLICRFSQNIILISFKNYTSHFAYFGNWYFQFWPFKSINTFPILALKINQLSFHYTIFHVTCECSRLMPKLNIIKLENHFDLKA